MNIEKLVKVALLSLLFPHTLSANQQANIKPNVVFIVIDDMGYTDLGINGSSFYETPNLDAMASNGTNFTNSYASHSVCSPTRAALMTGKTPQRLGITNWLHRAKKGKGKLLEPSVPLELALQEITLAEKLKELNYKTFFAGKWHLGGDGYLPTDQGFDINKGGYKYGQPPKGYYSPYQIETLTDGPEGEYLTDRLANETINFIEQNQDKPFLTYLSFYSVHTPLNPAKMFIDKYNKKSKALLKKQGKSKLRIEGSANTKLSQGNPRYASMVSSVDYNIGRVVDKLKQLDLLKNTLVIVTSDNGGLSTLKPGRDQPTSNEPYRAGKGWLYDGGTRIPQIMLVPGIKAGQFNMPTLSTDLYATVLDFVGATTSKEQIVDGISLLPYLKGSKKTASRNLVWHYPHYHKGSGFKPGSAIRSGDWKLIYDYETNVYQLYNHAKDISEKNNLIAVFPEKAEQLKTLLNKSLAEQGAKFPVSNPNFKNK